MPHKGEHLPLRRSEEDYYELFREMGALLEGHFQYRSGRHGHAYVNKNVLYAHTEILQALASDLAKRFHGVAIDAVVGPERGGIALSQWVAHALCRVSGREVLAFWSEKEANGTFRMGRGYERLAGKNVLVVDDIITTGSTLRAVVNTVRSSGGNAVALGALWNRGGVSARNIDPRGYVADFRSLIELELESWDAASCPLCQEKIPLSPM